MKPAPTPLPDIESLAQELKDFSYIVSHDLSAPLRAIVEFSRLLKAEYREAINEESKVYLSIIIESGQKMQQMLAGLLDYSRLNTMAKPLSKVNCNSVMDDCQIVLKEKIIARNAKLEIAALPTVEADFDQLMQLFLILIDNGLTFHLAGEAPHLWISACENTKKEWVFTVRDNGIGIDAEFYERVFQPFQRLHTDNEYPGIGMGLALVKKIVARHSGRLWIDSVLTKGTAINFTLPFLER